MRNAEPRSGLLAWLGGARILSGDLSGLITRPGGGSDTRLRRCQNSGVHNGLSWQKSSYCGSNACVEVAHDGPAVLMRDSKTPDGSALAFSESAWRTFIAGVQAGEFNV